MLVSFFLVFWCFSHEVEQEVRYISRDNLLKLEFITLARMEPQEPLPQDMSMLEKGLDLLQTLTRTALPHLPLVLRGTISCQDPLLKVPDLFLLFKVS